MQQKKRDDWKREKEKAGIQALGRNSRNQKRQQQHGSQCEGQIDPPAFGLGIEAVNELGEFRFNERPARTNRMPGVFGETCRPVFSLPHRIDQEKANCGNDDKPEQKCTDNGQQRIAGGVEQACAQKSDKTRGPDRSGTLGNKIRTNKGGGGRIVHAPMLRLMRHP